MIDHEDIRKANLAETKARQGLATFISLGVLLVYPTLVGLAIGVWKWALG